MSTNSCRTQIINGQSCVVCTGQPYVAAVPARIEVDPQLGWNASAYSRARHAGDCVTQFQMPPSIGAVVGLAPERRSNDPSDVLHGLYFYKQGGANFWLVQEAGVAITDPVAHAVNSDVFRIERRKTGVTYFCNGRIVHRSARPAVGSLVVVACLYAAEDGVY